MNRRDFLAALAVAAVAPRIADAEPSPIAGSVGTAPIADRLADYAWTLTYRDLDPATIEAAKAHLIDAIGCAISAFDEPVVRKCRNVAASTDGQATIIGAGLRTTAELATFSNGVAVRYYDLNDLYVGREPGHPSDNAAACIAVAEAERASAEDLLLAIVLAYEIDCRFLDAAELTARGWDHPIYSLPACALAAGKLMGLDRAQLTQAVNLAVNGHLAMNQTRVQQLSDWKGMADAEAARNAVFAARLARAGITGPAPVFEGRAGFFTLVSTPFTLDVDGFGGRRGRFRINDCAIKPYPAQGYTLTAIPAAIDVAKRVGDLRRIRAIEISTTHLGYVTAGRDPEKWRPQTKETADHSLPFIVVRAMLDGDITNDSYTPAAIHDPAAQGLLRKTTVSEDATLTAMQPGAIPNRVTVVLDDGSRLSCQIDVLPGLSGQPVSRNEIERKFRSNVSKHWSSLQTRAALDVLWDLDKQARLDGLMQLLEIRA
ncbi:2-methylcitrate dehydratase [Burkholderia singularis]|uniref:2-methylcitrate dehydratase n=1 Tax=Burkholderia singularis TaxID=1503053 RepID=A0A118DM91_9BURK|nr:MmgE/PrpD family protein [Burkholderia singularis]KVE24534.1 2-methylcitrate dehydratase [Burkholderia singularis]